MEAPGNSRSMIGRMVARPEHGLVAAAAMEHAVGEDVSAFEIARDLDFIDGEKRHVEVARHRLNGGDPEARILRLDLLLAGDQRDALGAARSAILL